MQVYTGNQALEIVKADIYPTNSIGIYETDQGWAYWYYDGHTFDFGIEENQEMALRKAKMNFK